MISTDYKADLKELATKIGKNPKIEKANIKATILGEKTRFYFKPMLIFIINGQRSVNMKELKRPVYCDEVRLDAINKLADEMDGGCGYGDIDMIRDSLRCCILSRYQDSFKVCKALESECNWECDDYIIDMIRDFDDIVTDVIRDNIKQWVSENKLTFKYSIGNFVDISNTGELCMVVGRVDELFFISYSNWWSIWGKWPYIMQRRLNNDLD